MVSSRSPLFLACWMVCSPCVVCVCLHATGTGFGACADTATEFAVKRLAGFIGSVNLAILCMLGVVTKNGPVVAGYFNGLAPLLVTGWLV